MLFLLPVVILTCRKRLEPTEMDMAEFGWTLYAGEEYREANRWFDDAVFEDSTYKDGYNGLGWTYGKLGELGQSISSFQKGRTLAFEDTTRADSLLLLTVPSHDVPKETTAGLALAYHATSSYQNAVIYGNSLLTLSRDSSYTASQGDPNWVFSRDPTIDARDIIWTLASSQYALGNFEKSLDHVRQLMSEPDSFSPDITAVEGRRELAEMIEFLRENL
ncbi:MAG: hypothetical protein ACE5HZ_08470 [Fidelibacterota bacterium]